MIESLVTTIDNPYDPFTEFDSWYGYDSYMGYHTPEFLARVLVSSDDLSEPDQKLALDRAVDEIVEENVLGIYVKVTREVEDVKD